MSLQVCLHVFPVYLHDLCRIFTRCLPGILLEQIARLGPPVKADNVLESHVLVGEIGVIGSVQARHTAARVLLSAMCITSS